jgi:hypothetical protein
MLDDKDVSNVCKGVELKADVENITQVTLHLIGVNLDVGAEANIGPKLLGVRAQINGEPVLLHPDDVELLYESDEAP